MQQPDSLSLNGEAARDYARLGFAVFPLRPATKIPFAGSRGVLDATTDEATVVSLWTANPTANIGISTTGLLVVDRDVLEDGSANPWPAGDPERAADLCAGLVVRTPRGGTHLIHRASKPYRNTASKLAPHVDTRADGGYIVAPPSVVNGKPYQLVEGYELTARDSLPLEPEWLAKLLDTPADKPAAITTASDKIRAGGRNAACTSFAGKMRRFAASQNAILAATWQFNLEQCEPPLERKEVETISHSVARYVPGETIEVDEAEPETIGPVDPGPFPEHLLSVPGLVDKIKTWNLETAHRPQPILALVGALCTLCVLIGRKVCDCRGNRSNLYFVSTAQSGGGKEHARKVTTSILYYAGLSHLEAAEPASDAGLIAAVEQQPAVLFQIDEFGRYLRNIINTAAASFLTAIVSVLLRLYSTSDSAFLGKSYADPTKNKVIHQPCVSLHSTTVPESLYQSLTAESLSDGFLARLLVFETSGTLPPRQFKEFGNPPADVVETARFWGNFVPGNGNMKGQFPQPKVVPTTDDAKKIFDELAGVVDSELTSGRPENHAIWARCEEKACRLALVYACSVNHENPVIDEAAARWACELSAYQTKRMIWLCSQWVSHSAFDALQKKIIRAVRDKGGSITKRELTRQLKHLPPRQRDEVVQNLLQTRQLEERVTTSGGRPKTDFWILSA
jgi:hypothetical protein